MYTTHLSLLPNHHPQVGEEGVQLPGDKKLGLDGTMKQTNEAGIDITPEPGFVIKTKRIDQVRR